MLQEYHWDSVIAATLPSETKRIRKLRWIGQAEEASRLERAAYASYLRRLGVLAEVPCSAEELHRHAARDVLKRA